MPVLIFKGEKVVNKISIVPYAKRKQKEKMLSRLLPVLLLLSFIWLNFYTTMTDINLYEKFSSVNPGAGELIADVLFVGIVDYLVFELLFFIYRFCLGFSIYSFMIPKQVLKNKFRFWYIIRNLILGIVFNVRFFFPYFSTYTCIFELLMNMLLVICLYFDLSKEYVEPLVGQFVFKTLAVPVLIYEAFEMVVLVWGVL